MRNIYLLLLSSLLLSACGKTAPVDNFTPEIISFIGGSGFEYGRAMAIDTDGNIVFTGHSNSTNLSFDYSYPADRVHKQSDFDILVGKYYVHEKRLVTAVIGGAGEDRSSDIELSANGDIYVAGFTESIGFPQTVDTKDSSRKSNVFVSVFNSDLSTLKYSRVIPGNGYDSLRSMKRNSKGDIYLAGSTASSNFPVKQNGFMTSLPEKSKSPWDIGLAGFVIKLSDDLQQIHAGTLLGGKEGDVYLYDMALTADGNVVVVGNTDSSQFPTTPGAFDTTYNGSTDIFISVLSSNLDELLASTYYGAEHYQHGKSVAVSDTGDIYIAGEIQKIETYSTLFPEAAQQYHSGGLNDIQIIRFDAGLSQILSATFLGKVNDEYATSLVSLGSGIVVTGYTSSIYFPPLRVDRKNIQPGTYDMFMVFLENDLSSIYQHYRIGGDGNDFAYDTAFTDEGGIFILGNSNSSRFAQQLNASGTTDKAMNLTLFSLPAGNRTTSAP